MSDWRCPIALPPRRSLSDGWRVCALPAGAVPTPAELPEHADWIDAPTLGPVAEVMRASGRWSLDAPPRRFDADDWWYRSSFHVSTDELQGDELWLGFDGLATLADVWLNGELLLQSTNMFVAHACPVTGRLQPGNNRIEMRFASLDAALAERRPRPRWRAPMVEHQQLRWFRTSLIGRLPGWSPPAAPVGPWKGVWLERRSALRVEGLRLSASVDATGVGQLSVALSLPGGVPGLLDRVELELDHAGARCGTPLQAEASPDGRRYSGTLSVAQPTLWWPHTHGEPALYRVHLAVWPQGADAPQRFDLGTVGFRQLALDTDGGRFALQVNGEPVFCRGACWTPLDIVRLTSTPEACRQAVAQVRDAGMNMLRLSGTLVYEDAAFFEACDELGVMVWQDFMFANMDFPADDPGFIDSVHTEVTQQMAHWQGRPCLAVLCGNSEVEQQAAMWGAGRALWHPRFFHETLRNWVAEALPGVPYWPSSAHGGALPQQANAGTCSYYGVGAYLGPLSDARRAELKFATECLAFANVPDEQAIARMPGGHALRVHHPAWKARAPRDLGAGWDFEDVRDHYLATLYGVDPMRLRAVDHARYLDLSRAVTGEVMAQAFSEWRRPASGCGGALVWLLRDLWAGAGWGLLDDTGAPKACFNALRRVLQPVWLGFTDEGLNGLALHLVNETAQPLQGEVEITVFGLADAVIAQSTLTVGLAPRAAETHDVAAGLDGFYDLNGAYRFGPLGVSLVHVRLHGAGRRGLGDEAFFIPGGPAPRLERDPGLSATLQAGADAGSLELHISARSFAHTVHIESSSHTSDDNDFHLPPGGERRIALRARRPGAVFKGQVTALNAVTAITLRAPE